MNEYNVFYTYNNLEQLREIQTKYNVYSFIEVESMNLQDIEENSYIDITSLVHFLKNNEDRILHAESSLKEKALNLTIIVDVVVQEDVLHLFPHIFNKYMSLLDCEIDTVNSSLNKTIPPIHPKIVYTYSSIDEINKITEAANNKGIQVVTFSYLAKHVPLIAQTNKDGIIAIVDLTSVIYTIKDNLAIIYSVESVLNCFHNIEYICINAELDLLMKYFPLYFSSFNSIDTLFPELKDVITHNEFNDVIVVKRITDLSKDEVINFVERFNHSLVGHYNFKRRFIDLLYKYIDLNRINKKPIFSVFIFGNSGIGKTEVARVIAESIKENGRLVKINFQNYSSQDALNNLIGSSRGYIGCEEGELSLKLRKNTVGVILCDEFEKTTRQVFSFFLEMLEEGQFTDSMAREFNLKGYIVIFTSNIQNEYEYKSKIPPELQTRFDLVCEFQSPYDKDKYEFLRLLIEKTNNELIKNKIELLSKKEEEDLLKINYESIDNMRDIKRVFDNKLAELLKNRNEIL